MFSLSVHPDAVRDLADLKATSREAYARILALLEQIKNDPRLLEALLDHDFGADRRESFNVKRFESQWHSGRNLWRLKAWELDRHGLPYRVVYGYEIKRQRYHILGVIHHKGFNYESNHPFTQRVLHAYDDVCT